MMGWGGSEAPLSDRLNQHGSGDGGVTPVAQQLQMRREAVGRNIVTAARRRIPAT